MASTFMSSQTIDHVKAPYPNEANVGAVDVVRDGQTVVIFYTLRYGKNIHWCNIDLYLSMDGGKTYVNISSSKNLSGDIGRISTEGDKKIMWNISDSKKELADKPLVFKVEITKKDIVKRDYMVLAAASVYPSQSYGLMISTTKKVGFYVKARANMINLGGDGVDIAKSDGKYYKRIDGELYETGGFMLTTGKETRERYMITGGIMFRLNKNIYPYIGAGTGFNNLFWECYSSSGKKWACIEDKSHSGLTLDAGCIFRFGNFVVSAAASNTVFKYTEGEIGIGYVF